MTNNLDLPRILTENAADREAAHRATPGPYQVCSDDEEPSLPLVCQRSPDGSHNGPICKYPLTDDDATNIARNADPARTLARCADVEAMAAMLKRMAGALRAVRGWAAEWFLHWAECGVCKTERTGEATMTLAPCEKGLGIMLAYQKAREGAAAVLAEYDAATRPATEAPKPNGAEPFCHACDPVGVERAKGGLPVRDRRRLQPDSKRPATGEGGSHE